MMQPIKLSNIIILFILLLQINCQKEIKILETPNNLEAPNKLSVNTVIIDKSHKINHQIWVFDKVFEEAIDNIPIKDLENKTNEFKNSKIEIKDNIFKFDDKCKFEYVVTDKTPKTYWFNNVDSFIKSFNPYIKLLKDKKIKIYHELFPNEQCEYPTSEYILIDDTFYFISDGYIISFRKSGSPAIPKTEFYDVIEQDRLPLKYNFDYIIEEKGYKDIPQNLYPKFNLDGLNYLKIKKLPSKKYIDIYLVIGKNEEGQSNLYLFSMDNKHNVIDNIELYFSEEIDAGLTHLKEYNISEDYIIIINEYEISNGKKKVLFRNTFLIDDKGKFIKK